MEALHSCLTTGEQSGGQEHRQPESQSRGPLPRSPSQPRRQQQTSSPKPHGTLQQARQSKRQHPERKRLRHQRQSVDSESASENKLEAATKATAVSSLPPGAPSSSAGGATQNKTATQEGTPKQKRERKPQTPGKYVCTYCGRACAKPSVLQKHIRSHTGERPYPCTPCGFSFKTKSNLYKHRKSHTHRVKAGLALGEPRSLDEQVTESEDETRQLSSVSSLPERQSAAASMKSCEMDRAKDGAGGNSDSYAVKKRLALRLSRGKHGPQGSSDEKTSSLTLGSKGSTESGYFSRSESTELPQDSPQNTSATSYAEIILGKYGRLGHLQRTSRHHSQQPSAQEDKSVPFTVPKKQVIEHITKLITINEAVVDTSKIDSVKPRRFSLSRKNSSESQKSSSVKEQLVHSPKTADVGYKNSGSITMGVPCEKFHHPSLNVEQPAGQTSAALVRSHSVPTAASSFDCGPGKFRPSQSFDERKPSGRQASRRYGMLRRQPAIEIPLVAELAKEEHDGSHSFYPDSLTTTPDHKRSPPQLYECEACGTGCKDWEGYKRHKQSLCPVHYPKNETAISQIECSRLSDHSVRAGASTMRKRRKEESFELDEPSSPSLPSPVPVSGQCKDDSNVVYEGPRRPTLQTCSVIQHTSSFEKQESLCNENQGTEPTKTSPPHDQYQLLPHKQHQQESTKFSRKLVRQPNVLVPEILVTEDSNTSTGTSLEPTPKAKHSEKSDEFQWPQRSPSLSQLPIEKLPPKKKRLRLAEAAQSSGESSFDSVSLSRSPSQDSSASYASSRSTSFEESNRPDMELTTLTPLRKSRASDTLTVPGVHQHREMRRSASEQAPHDPQPSVPVAETRSKSFDYSCLSPERTAAGWRERRKCLLMRHTAVRDPDEEEQVQRNLPSRSPEHVSPSVSSQASPTSVCRSGSAASPLSGDAVVSTPVRLQCKEIFSQWNLSQSIQLPGTTEPPLTHRMSAEPGKEEASQIHARPPPQAPHSYPTHGPSGAARARYLPMSTGLKLEIPSLHDDYSEAQVSHSHIQHPAPHITTSQELLRPATPPAVAVRLQTDTVTLGCAIYTTLSQVTSPTPEEKLDVVSQNVPTAEYVERRNTNPDLQLWSDDDLRISGSGGNKRVLSPSNSIEIPPESQQQQKRVKEEEGREVGCVDKAFAVTCGQEVEGESRPCLPAVCTPSKHPGSSFPSLLSSTCHSWCYLNYLKPSPSPLDQQKPSVYSAWSTSGYDPNPPGVSSKTALSLLHCKQRLSPSIYTLSAMTVRTPDSEEDQRRPCSSEVCSSRSDRRDGEDSRAGQQSAVGSNRKEEREGEEKEGEEEEVQSCSREKQPPEVWVSERRSDERCGGGGGKSRIQPELPQHVCKAEAEGILGSQGTGTCCRPAGATDQDQEAEAADGGGEGEEARSEEASRSKASEGSNDGEKSRPIEPRRPREPAQRSSASLRRALFARRRLDASACVPPGGSQSPGTQSPFAQRAPSPPSPRPSPPPAAPHSLSPSSGDVSTSSLKPVSHVGGLSPAAVRSGCESSEPPASLAGTSAQCPARLHPGDQPQTARSSTDQVGLSPVGLHPTRPRGANNLLSHLPLHSQPPSSRAPSLLIPIGGIHMVQPRSLLPLYSLVHSPAGTPTAAEANPAGANANPAAANANPAAAKANPACAPWRLSDSPLLHQDSLKETLPSSPPSSPSCNPRPPDRGAISGDQSEAPSDRKSRGRSSVHQPSRTETRRPEGNADTPVPERRVHPETI